jgi:hypothetical protein
MASSQISVPTETRTIKRLVIVAIAFGMGFGLVCSFSVLLISYFRSRPKPWNKAAITATFDQLGTEGADQNLVFFYVAENTTPFDYKVTDQSGVFLSSRLSTQKALGLEKDYETLQLPILIPAKQRVRLQIDVPFRFRDACEESIRNPQPERRTGGKVPSGTGTISDLASAVRTKFESCKAVDDLLLVNRLLKIYPVYRGYLRRDEVTKLSSETEPTQAELKAYVRKEMGNVDGFVLLDPTKRFEIDLPRGW